MGKKWPKPPVVPEKRGPGRPKLPRDPVTGKPVHPPKKRVPKPPPVEHPPERVEAWNLPAREVYVPAHGRGHLLVGPPAANRASPRAAKKEFLQAIATAVPDAIVVMKRLLESKDERINLVGVEMLLRQMMGKGADRAFDTEDGERHDDADPSYLSQDEQVEYMGLIERMSELNRKAREAEQLAGQGVIDG
jgi:hypothetical protein